MLSLFIEGHEYLAVSLCCITNFPEKKELKAPPFSSRFCASAGSVFSIGSADLCWFHRDSHMLQSAGKRASLTRLVVGRLVRLGPPQPEWLIPSPCGSSSSSRLTWASSHGGLRVPQNREQVPMFSYFLSLWLCPIDQSNSHSQAQSQCETAEKETMMALCANYPSIPLQDMGF